MKTILPFGQFKDYNIQNVPDRYLFWLADRGRSTYYKSEHSLDIVWKVPFNIWEAARIECDKRGYTKIGLRWEAKS